MCALCVRYSQHSQAIFSVIWVHMTGKLLTLPNSDTEWATEDSQFDFRQVKDISFFSIKSRPALGSTQPPLQWVPGGVSQERGG
jgi:hypothetical protein